MEEITAKTGNFKKFGVFVRMLLSALRRESEAVATDLLTYADLELLRSQRASAVGSSSQALQQPAQPPSQQQQRQGQRPTSNKRYLILTYAAEFDRVHYPLPLAPEDAPDPQRLKAIIRELRAGQQQQQHGARLGSAYSRRAANGSGQSSQLSPLPELRALREENALLKQQVRALQEAAGSTGSLAADVQALTADAQETIADLRAMRKERDALLLRAQQAEAALEGERNLHRRELRRRAKEASDTAAEMEAAKDQSRELRLKCRQLTQELDLAQRRAKVAALSSDYCPRPRLAAAHPARAAAGSRGGTAAGSRGTSPGRGAFYPRSSTRDASPAPSRGRGPPPGPGQLRSRSADVSRHSSRPSSRPASAGRFDPTEYVRQRREREREAAARLEDLRRQARLPSPGGSRPSSCPGSLPRSRPGSLPSSRDATPQRSRVPSRDSCADRARVVGSSSGRSGARQGGWQRGELARSTQRLRAAVATTQPAGNSGLSFKDQRSMSPGRALQEVKDRLQSYAAKGGAGGSSGLIPAAPPALSANGTEQQQQVVGRLAAASGGDAYADASAEIQDIDARLQSLQNFLRVAKGGSARSPPVAVQ